VDSDLRAQRWRADDDARPGGTQRGDRLIENGQPTAGLDRALCAAPSGNSVSAGPGAPAAGLTRAVASDSDASSRRAAFTSTAMTRAAGVSIAAMTATRPTPPAPKMTTVLPGSGRATLRTAATPVWTLQPNGASCDRSRSSSTFTADRALTRACVANEDCPKKCPCSPLLVRVRVALPSNRDPPSKLSGIQC